MRALRYQRYGGEEELSLVDVPEPIPARDEVRVAVRATSLNGADAEFLCGRPIYARLAGVFRPRKAMQILGSDVAGVVDAVGEEVEDLRVGDAVYGDLFEHFGGLAEKVCAPRRRWLPMPEALSFEVAAAIPQAGVLAWQGIERDGALRRGQRVLIVGAGGCIGTFAVQMARTIGAEVTAVDRQAKLERLEALGAHRTIDFMAHPDYAGRGDDYDLILDTAGRGSLTRFRRALAPTGRYFIVGGRLTNVLHAAGRGLFPGTPSLGVLGWDRAPALVDMLGQRVAAGTLRPIIDSVVPLERAAEGFSRMLHGTAVGKVVVTAHAALRD